MKNQKKKIENMKDKKKNKKKSKKKRKKKMKKIFIFKKIK